MQKALSGAVTASAIALLSLPALGADHKGYEFITVDLPNGLMPGAFMAPGVGGINDRGWIVGAYQTTSFGLSQAFLDTGRTFTTIGGLAANGVNNRGTIVGIYTFGGIVEVRGFIYRNGKSTTIDALPGLPGSGTVVHPEGISNNGVIVGWGAAAPMAPKHGFVRSAGGQITTLDLAGDTFLTGVNDRGAIVGYYSGGSFLRQPNGAVSPIQVPGASQTFVNAINDRGEVVGYYQMTASATATHGFVLDKEGFVTIDVPGASSTMVTGINNHGELVGRFDDAKGAHVFLARPQEERDEDITER